MADEGSCSLLGRRLLLLEKMIFWFQVVYRISWLLVLKELSCLLMSLLGPTRLCAINTVFSDPQGLLRVSSYVLDSLQISQILLLSCLSNLSHLYLSGFVRVLENLESPGISFCHFPGLESPGKWPRVLESPGNLN